MMSYPKISIIILNWNGLKDTIECLQSVRKSDYSNYETIVIDNASLDNEADKIKSAFPEVTVIGNSKNLGFTGGNNLGMRYALDNGADYIWLLNNDAIIESNTLSELVKEGEKSERTGLLSPVIYYYSTPNKIQFCGSYFDFNNFEIKLFKNLTDAHQSKNNNTALWGTALLIKRAVAEKIGFLNERFFAYYEDSDYSLKALKNGFLNKMVFSARIFHKSHSIDVSGIKSQPVYFFYYMTRNEYWLWIDRLSFVKKISFLRKYLARLFRMAGNLEEISEYEKLEAVMNGLYCGFKYIGGRLNNSKRMPEIIKKFILWRPYFLAEVLDLNFNGIIIEIFERFIGKNKLSKINSEFTAK